ncbi:MAG: ABC transporter ATP-binding protein [Geodermatophilaceae bacterium]|nr:ABC transporter ATP-binding protein [Geodermatophilaceae bacterium]MDQ3474876.1 ABC transporter ATP-binding protein [Actinomycetota bacterium]
MQEAVDVTDLVVTRGGKEVLNGLTCSVRQGSVTGLLGPSGSGKTTLMRCLVGVQIVTSGSVRVLGAAAGSAGLRHRVGYVTQSPSVYSDLTVAENARYFAAVLGASGTAADKAIADVGLKEQSAQLVATLSGGQRTRASLACALLGDPELLILDEPTVGLDPVLREELWGMFASLAAGGTTLVVSSHVMDEAGRCDRILLLRDGALIADDSPDALRHAAGTDDLDRMFLSLIQNAEAA